MDKDVILVIFPDEGSRYVLLVSQSGKVQVYEMPEHIAAEAFMQGLAQTVGISLDVATFEEAHDELTQRLMPVDLPADDVRKIMQQAMFRFLMQKEGR